MDKVLKRNEIDDKYKWNLKDIYENAYAFNSDFEYVEGELSALITLKNNAFKSYESFEKYLKKDEELERKLYNLEVYASLYSDQDKNNTDAQSLLSRVESLISKYDSETSDFVPRMLDVGEEKIKSFLITPYLKEYKHTIDNIFREKDHSLSKEEEKVISAYSRVLNSSSDTASYLLNTDTHFESVKDKDGKEHELNESLYSLYIRSDDRILRKNAFENLYKGYKNILNSLTSTYSSVCLCDSTSVKLRGYKSSLEMYLYPKNISTKLYDNLIKTVRNNLDSLYEYYDLKKKILGYSEYHLYDTYTSITNMPDKKYTFMEAKEIVKSALGIMGDEYIKALDTEFNNRWIDVYPNVGKRGGGYQVGSYDTHPYILLNFNGTLNDVSTLAHESGHAMHTYFANKYNSYINSNYPIFLAEIASTTNELLLSDYMYKNSKSTEEKKYILNERLDLYKATIYRQTMFAEFELYAHELSDNDMPITGEDLCNKYLEFNKDYFGDGVVVDDSIKYEWERIPHFYTPFYVYQYATSLCIASYIADNIIKETKGFKDKYIEFLKKSGTDYPLEVLKIIGIDLNDTKVFESSLSMFKNDLKELEKLYK